MKIVKTLHFLMMILFTVASFRIQAFDYPNEFQIQQEPSRRVFSIVEGTQLLGEIFNSNYGQFDFYDRDKTKICTNLDDALYDNDNHLLSFIEWKKDEEAEKWFWQRRCFFCPFKTHMVLFSNEKISFLTFDEEGEGNAFVFRECKMGKPIAVALWSWKLLGNSCFAKFDDQVQNWNLIIVDRAFLDENQISPLFLIWALLKHSQLYFPEPRVYPYIQAK